MKERIKQILKELIQACKETEFFNYGRVSEDKLLEEAVKIYISENISQDKKENIKSMGKVRGLPASSFEPPTKSQIKFLKDNKKSVPKTKQEAWAMIKKIKNG